MEASAGATPNGVDAAGGKRSAPPGFASATTVLGKTIANFRSAPGGVPDLHATAAKKYDVFCRRRQLSLHAKFLALVGDEDATWCGDTKFVHSCKANVPFPGKKNERPVSGGRCNTTGRPHGVIRYQYKANVIEEGRKGGQPHGLRVVCTQMGDIWIRLHKNGERLAQVVLHADLSENSSMAKDDGGLKTLRQHLHLIQDCFVNTGWPKQN